MIRGGTVYMMTNKSNSVLYIGVTANLWARIFEHREKLIPSCFTFKYNINKLVYFNHFSSIEEAIHEEKRLKRFRREKKNRLVENMNPAWDDLYIYA